MLDLNKPKKIEKNKFSKFDRDVLLSSKDGTIFSNEDEFLKFYRKVLRFAIFKKYDSVELPLLCNDINITDSYISKINELIEKVLEKHQISIGFYGENLYTESNLQLFERYGVYICQNSEPILDENDFENISSDYGVMCHKIMPGGRESTPKLSKSKCKDTLHGDELVPLAPKIKCDPRLMGLTFSEKLLDYIIKSGMSNVEVYNASWISRQVFSNLISGKIQVPSKATIFCLIIGLKLNIKDAYDLLNSAGYTFSPSILLDVIVKDYVDKKEFNMWKINDELDKHQLPILGWKPRE